MNVIGFRLPLFFAPSSLFTAISLLHRHLSQVLASALVADPVLFFPVFYTFKESLNRPAQRVFQLDTVRAALRNYQNNCLSDVRNSVCIWLPGHCITYGLLPTHLRMPWIAALSFGYVSLLSLTRGTHGETRSWAKLSRSQTATA